jgi:hypothetical protein
MVEEARLKTVRILRDSSKLKDNLRGTERRELTDLTILLADKVIAAVVLNTVDYNHNIGALLQDQTYRRVAKDPTKAVNPHFCLRGLHLQMRFASDYITQAQNCQGYIYFLRFLTHSHTNFSAN